MSDGKNIIGISKVFQYGKTQVPSDVRKELVLRDGDRIYYVKDYSGKIWIEKAPTNVNKSKY